MTSRACVRALVGFVLIGFAPVGPFARRASAAPPFDWCGLALSGMPNSEGGPFADKRAVERKYGSPARFIRKGGFAVVQDGVVPEPGVRDWPPGSAVAVKFAVKSPLTVASIAHEVEFIKRVEAADDHGLFVRGELDRDYDNVMVLEDVDAGRPLSADSLRAAMTPALGASIKRQLIEALAVLRRANVVHGDLMPRNVHIMPDGRLKIFDFGGAAEHGKRPAYLKGERVHNDMFSSPNVLRDGPAVFEDDEYSVNKILEYLRIT